MKSCKNINYFSKGVPFSRGCRQTDKQEVTLAVLIQTFSVNFNFDLHICFKNLIVEMIVHHILGFSVLWQYWTTVLIYCLISTKEQYYYVYYEPMQVYLKTLCSWLYP